MNKIIDITNKLKDNSFKINQEKGEPNMELCNKFIEEYSKTENEEDFTVHLDNVANLADTLTTMISMCFSVFLETYGSDWVNNAICDTCNSITEQTGNINKF